jgi:hypothetical protein
MVEEGVLEQCPSLLSLTVNPFRAVLKNSALIAAKVHTGIEVQDDASLNASNLLLNNLGHMPLKVRMTTNCSASGVNRATPNKQFSYPTLSQALNIVSPNAWLAKGDVRSYFWLFPLAVEVRSYFACYYSGVNFVYTKCPFGFKLCPWFCSLWAAEFRQWLLSRNITCCHYVDDWLLVESSEELARSSMTTLTSVFQTCGIAMAPDKFEFGRSIVYLGVVIDTVSMTVRFDPIQARGFCAQLVKYYNIISGGGVVDAPTVHHVCGKLQWFAEVVQMGRVKSRSWWIYLKYGEDLIQSAKDNLLVDTAWWIHLLNKWTDGENYGNEYPIISSSYILNNLDQIILVQSDMSGPDGLGYHTYLMTDPDTDVDFFAMRWCPNFLPSSSMEGELLALEEFLKREGQAKYAHRRCTIVWVSDSMSAVWAILKGRCHHPSPLAVLVRILELCDDARLQLLALWVPREQNSLADYLSHLCVLLDRDSVSGGASDLREYTMEFSNGGNLER